MRPIDADELKRRILFERDKIPFEVPCAVYELRKSKPNHHGNAMRGGVKRALRCMEQTPTITLADLRPKGRWIAQDETLTKFMCSVCESKNYGGYEKFCPNCGADMRGGGE